MLKHLGRFRHIVKSMTMIEKRAIEESTEQVSKRPNLTDVVVKHYENAPGTKMPKHLTVGKKGKVKRKYTQKNLDPTNPFGVLLNEVDELFKEYAISEEQRHVPIKEVLNSEELLMKYHREIENVKVLRLTPNGEGLALIPHATIEDGYQACVIPFAYPGEIVDVRIFRTHPTHCEADLVNVKQSSELRDDSLIQCKYFGKCSGCQYQNIAYESQLDLKKQTIINAYKSFAPVLTKSQKLPQIGSTVASPKQYGYRTKLTPHFDLPRGKFNPDKIRVPALGFGAKGRPEWRKDAAGGQYSILDVEECAIGTDIINKAMAEERKVFLKTYKKFERGSTILLRENTLTPAEEVGEGVRDSETQEVLKIEEEDAKTGLKLTKTCVKEQRQIVQEYIDGFKFNFSAGEFFQNNNSILPIVTQYVRENILVGTDKYLVDAYCGSGLFSVMCCKNVKEVIGVEVSKDSVEFAKKNVELNGIENASFIVGKAEKIFDDIKFPKDKTSIICDPPRKGCDELFLNQLSAFNPAKVVYISCNVHSQARDLDFFINKTTNGAEYEIESIRGFDFFPQTHHVESVAVLTKKVSEPKPETAESV